MSDLDFGEENQPTINAAATSSSKEIKTEDNLSEMSSENNSEDASSSEDSYDNEEIEKTIDLEKMVSAAVEKAKSRFEVASVTAIERTKLPPLPTPISTLVSVYC